ncbi:MAG: GAF domain-containing protein [Nitrospirae bacterium]|nr:GAF domain-containing protein [Nitrospirota bacterium]
MEETDRARRKIGLNKLISRKEESAIVSDIIALAGCEITIYDADGRLIQGRDQTDVARIPIEFDGDTVGWVSGGENAPKVAAFLRYLYATGSNKRALVKDSLEKYKEITLLYDLGEKITDCLDIHSVAVLIIEETKKIIRSDNVSLMLLEGDQGELAILEAWGEESPGKLCMKKGKGIAGSVAASGAAEIVNDVAADSRFIVGEKIIHSLICAPLKVKDKVIGVLNISSSLPHSYSSGDLKMAMVLAYQAAMTIDNVRNRSVRETFGRYLSDEIVRSILETPGGMNLGGEKRTVTILMSDLRGFTSIGERSPAENVVGMINIYLSVMTEIILKYHGTIDEFIGDAILVIFGAPIQRDDDMTRAVACAVEMQTAMEEVNRRNREAGYHEVAMGIGINTGSVVVGNIGSNKRTKYAVVGRNVNLTSRIESYTVGGQILASQGTVEACGEILRIDSTMEVMPKGVQKPLTIYEVGGIGGNYNLVLPEKKRTELPELDRPLLVRFKVLDGKNVAGESFKGRILKMSGMEAEIHADLITDRLSNLRITLAGTGSNETAPELYAKVTENISAEPPVFRACLTSAASQVQTFMNAAYYSGGKDRHMTIKFLGVGSQFSGHDYYHSNMLITAKSGKKLLLDCGSDIRFSLKETDIPLGSIASEIDAVYISHLHSDHIGGVETIALCSYFSPGDQKPKLFAEDEMIPRLWLDSLKGGLQCIQGRCMELGDYFECCPVPDAGSFLWEGIKFSLIKMPHIQSGQKEHNSYGLIIEEQSEGVNVFVTADTQFRPELINEIAEGVDLIFHDCETSRFKTGVHAHYEELCTLPEEVKLKIWLYHYQPDPVYNPEADGFRGFVIKGQEFEIKHKRYHD